MRNLHVVIPFSRPYLLDILLGIYGNCSSINLIVTDEQFSLFKDRWKPYYPQMIVMPYGEGDLCYMKINHFIQTQPIIDDDYYWCMCDDDAVEYNVIPSIKEMNDDIIFISMKRGQWGIYPHPATTLIAHPTNVNIGTIGLEQVIIKGSIFKTLTHDINNHASDGAMAVYLYNRYKDKIKFVPDLYVMFNWFQPGRWDME